MATSLTLQNDASLAQGYVKVNGTTSATFTTSGITGNLTGNVTGSLTAGGSLTLATAQTASGTAVDFTGIPSWAKRITVMFNGVSASGTSDYLIQIGAGGIANSGYTTTRAYIQTTTPVANSGTTAGIAIFPGVSASSTWFGNVNIATLGSNIWTSNGIISTLSPNTTIGFTSGGITLSGTLDRVRITTVSGTDTFDAGTINISFEG
jgi:hypothetical protein